MNGGQGIEIQALTTWSSLDQMVKMNSTNIQQIV